MAKVDAYYPPSPINVPEDLTEPTAEYKHRAFLVLISLLLFFFFYLGLIVGSLAICVLSMWFLPIGLVAAVPSAFFFLFLIKGFFKRGEKEKDLMIEITEDEQPLLFDFIDCVCAEVGAPPPRKVFVSPDLSAAVMPPLSILSLFWPTGKDLLIGLGGVNALNLSEFKSVMAHEFGHFSQKSLRFTGYVYQANLIITDLVVGRDWLDSLLDGWKRLDIRIAWAAYLMAGLVWLLRKVLEGFYYLICLLRLSLMRQMELNADLVAVSVAGSDARVHALYRYGFAEETWNQVISDLRAAADHKLYTADLFYHVNHAANYLPRRGRFPSGESAAAVRRSARHSGPLPAGGGRAFHLVHAPDHVRTGAKRQGVLHPEHH